MDGFSHLKISDSVSVGYTIYDLSYPVAKGSSCADSKHELYSHQLSSLFSRVLASLHAPRVNSYSRTFYITCDYITKNHGLVNLKS